MIRCPSCGSRNMETCFARNNVPVFQNLRCTTQEEALNVVCDNLELQLCRVCGMVHNSIFRSELVDYGVSYENSQFVSREFVGHIEMVIDILLHQYRVYNTKIVEIGCGNGLFLSELVRKTESKGFGYDPAFSDERVLNAGGGGGK